MTSSVTNYFLDIVCHCRKHGEIIIHGRYDPITPASQEPVVERRFGRPDQGYRGRQTFAKGYFTVSASNSTLAEIRERVRGNL